MILFMLILNKFKYAYFKLCIIKIKLETKNEAIDVGFEPATLSLRV